jgi:hypothetical protein
LSHNFNDVEADALKRLFGKNPKIEINISNYGKLNRSLIEAI